MTKLNFFILEDDFFHQGRIENAIKLTIKKYNVQYRTFEIFDDPNELLENISEKGSHNLFFIDIEIKSEEKKGFDIARTIRQLDKTAMIIFVTTHTEFTPVSFRYQVSAFDYIPKDIKDDSFNELIESAITYAIENNNITSDDIFIISNHHSKVEVPFSDILYFEVIAPHKLLLVTRTGLTEFYGKISDLPKIDNRLFLSHKSVVVNPYNVKQIDKKNNLVLFEDGESCSVSKRKLKDFLNLMEEIKW